jgi:hypothetical protein
VQHYPDRVTRATTVLALAVVAGPGCALDGSTEPKPAKGATREIAGVVERLERASARGDWRTVCDRLFTAAAKRRAGGSGCVRRLRSDAGGLAEPRLDVVRIALEERGRASVRVRSRARGQPPLEDVIELRRERGEYRVESLRG